MHAHNYDQYTRPHYDTCPLGDIAAPGGYCICADIDEGLYDQEMEGRVDAVRDKEERDRVKAIQSWRVTAEDGTTVRVEETTRQHVIALVVESLGGAVCQALLTSEAWDAIIDARYAVDEYADKGSI